MKSRCVFSREGSKDTLNHSPSITRRYIYASKIFRRFAARIFTNVAYHVTYILFHSYDNARRGTCSADWIGGNKRDAILFLAIRGILTGLGLQSSRSPPHRFLPRYIQRATKFSAALCFKPEECKQITTLFSDGWSKLSDPRAPPDFSPASLQET